MRSVQTYRSQDDYEVVRKVGRGKYSEVIFPLSLALHAKHDGVIRVMRGLCTAGV